MFVQIRTKLNNLATGGSITAYNDPVWWNSVPTPFIPLPYAEKNSVFFTGTSAKTCKWQNTGWPVTFYRTTDLWDVDNNGVTNLDTLCFGSAYVNVTSQAQMESIKWVMGQLDAGYSRYPQTGKTVQGGLADYRLVVKNNGNVPMKDVIVVDILPFIGDMGVIDLSARNTMWRPNLANPITAPAGVTVYYSTAQNPCRDEVKTPSDPSPFPTGCTPANWTLAPLPDITSVQSLKFDFGNIVLGPQDSLVLNWPMRAPTDAPANGEIAWNSFGFVATRTDNNQKILPAEPFKVGIEVFEANPGVYGDYVWIDTNMDGIQNEVNTGVSGVVVEFYRDNGDGISNPLTDVLVSYTVTDANGRYLFPDLIPADYYAVFYPPAGYVVTLTNQGGNDAIDSDGIIMPVTHIDAGEDDRTWDLGLFLSPNCDVNISFVSVSPCYWDGTSSQVVVNAYITWANAPVGQDIEVTLNGQTQTIDVSGGAQQMAFVTFTIPSDNTLYTINACFTGGSNCCESRTLKPHLPCNPNQCYLDIVNTYTGSCDGTNYILDVEVNWSVPPAGEDIIVTAGGQTQTINVSGGITPPVCAVFTLPANGMTGLPVTASFETTTSCADSGTYDSPTCVLSCEICPDQLNINGITFGSGSAPLAENVTTNGSTPLSENNIAGFRATGSSEGIFYTFCTMINQPVLPLQNPYNRVANGATNGFTILQGEYLAKLFQVAGFNSATGFGAGNNTTTNMVAMQMAVWNIIYDTDFTISSGSFQLLTDNNPGVRALANSWLAAAQTLPSANTSVERLVHATGQDLIFQNCLSTEPGTCNSTTNAYTLAGNVFFANAPSTGTLTVSVAGGGSQVFNAPFTSPIGYSIAGQGECGSTEGTVTTLTGSIQSGSNPPVTQSVSTTLHSTNKFCPGKSNGVGLALDNSTIYNVRLGFAGNGYLTNGIGTSDVINVSMIDNLPPNTIINGVTLTGNDGFYGLVYPPNTCIIDNTPSAPKVTCTFPSTTFEVKYTGSPYTDIKIDVTYPDANFNANDNVTNSVTVNYTPLGGSPITATNGTIINYIDGVNYSNTTPKSCTANLDVTDMLSNPNPILQIRKTETPSTIRPGDIVKYEINVSNTGNVILNDVVVEDIIPNELEVTSITDYSSFPGTSGTEVRTLMIKTVSNPTYTTVTLPYTAVSGDYITAIKSSISSIPAGAQFLYLRVFVKLKPNITSGTITNCLTGSTSTPGATINSSAACVDLTVLELDNFSTLSISKFLTSTPNSQYSVFYGVPQSVGTTVWSTLYFQNQSGGQPLQNPIVADLLPIGLDYDGAIQYGASGCNFPNADNTEIIPNYQGTGRTLVRLTWNTPMPTGCDLWLAIKTKISNLAPGGTANDTDEANAYNTLSSGLKNSAFFTGSSPKKCYRESIYSPMTYFEAPDLLDIDNDGLTTTDTICRAYYYLNITSTAQLSSVKWVMGQLDSGYSKYPDHGKTVQGGLADYRLVVKNTGNIPMKDIVVIDILPFIGDMGVIDLSARNTMWRPNLANPIIAPAGVTVYYSTAQNPCRDEVKTPSDPSPFPTGCTPANWTLAPLPDITSVQSLKFDFGNIVLGAQDSLVLNWPMRAPTDAPANGEIAWNSFGYVATRTDNNQTLLPAEPFKVGIEVFEANPGVYGDYVWIDTNMDGIQNEVNTGVSGVVVEFYRDNGDGISNPLTDVLVSYTVTDANGRYLFPDLIPGDYYAVFYPPAGYVVTLTNQGGNDSIDSDGIIMPVTHIDAGEDDRTWDLGLFLSPNCDVNISFVSVSPCYWDGTSSQVVVNAYITWANAPAGQDIEVTLNGQTQTIDVSGGAEQMAFVTFTIPSDNTLYTINACFTGGSNCCESRTLKPHLPCNPNQCYLDIVNTYTGSCDGTNYILDVEVNWSVPPAGEDIIVTAGGQTQTINVSGGITPPVCAVFTLPANGMTGLPVTASFETTTSCSDSDTFNSPTCVLCNLATQCNPSPQTSCTPVNGSATVTVTGGQGNITYIWSSGETTSSISSKAAGTYTVTVTDDFVPGCTSTCQAIITSSTTLPTATCAKTDNTNCASPNGTATVTTNANQILWSNAATTASISGLSGGTYTVTVTNTTTGCTNTCQSVVANATVNPTCNITANTQPSCANLTGGSITVNPSPAGTYTYNWSDIGSGGANRTGLSGGTYTVTVTNTTSSCTGVCQVTLTTPTNCCNINAIVPQNIICYDNGTPGLNTDNRIRFNANVTNTNTSLTSYNVAINGGTTITPNTNVPYGPMLFTLGPGTAGGGATFTVTVTDSATPGCTQTFQIVDPGNCDPGGPGDECPTPKCGTATIQANGN